MKYIAMLFCIICIVACSNDEISYRALEDNLSNINVLNSKEQHIATKILDDAKNGTYCLITTDELHDLMYHSAQLSANAIRSETCNNNIESQNASTLQIISTSPRGVYILGFIEGTKNIGFNTTFSGIWEDDVLDSATKERFGELLGDVENMIVFYDNGQDSAKNGARWAIKMGYKRVYLLVGGFNAWKERDYLVSFDMPECCQI